ncbi:hypothetical protein ACFVW1_46795 [Streptomyces olivochromogenes]|uniref:hypothetical protein n=1 Tax=Streptomyces olivochromogenes TaxID=1963 RepID=UPI0036DBCE6C
MIWEVSSGLDACLEIIQLTDDATGMGGQKDRDAVGRPVRDLRRRHAIIEPVRQAGAPQVVHPFAER